MKFFTKYVIRILDCLVKNPEKGLPDSVFYYISRTTPLVNVDLLIKDHNNRVLLSWRDDEYSGTGWHIPGGIIRYKENIKQRIDEVARTELRAPVTCNLEPIAVNEVIADKQRNRGHFISLLFTCFIDEEYVIENKNLTPSDPGFLKWHQSCPSNLVSWHEIYRGYI
jgi:ADP-ribose pyrophosphatase YjhB (NUDIX family)